MDERPSNTGGKNQTFAEKNKNSLVVVGIVVVLLVIYFATRGSTQKGMEEQGNSNQSTEQMNSSSENMSESDANTNTGSSTPTKPSTTQGSDTAAGSGNVAVTGKLLVSDNAAKGNLMVSTSRGAVYVQTGRDFSTLIGQEVTLMGNGTITAFTLADIKAGSDTAMTPSTDNTAKGGNSETPPPAAPTGQVQGEGDVMFSGNLSRSDDPSKGDYVITSGKTKVYLKTSRDYSAWVGSDVNLAAAGSLKSFTNAKVTKK